MLVTAIIKLITPSLLEDLFFALNYGRKKGICVHYHFSEIVHLLEEKNDEILVDWLESVGFFNTDVSCGLWSILIGYTLTTVVLIQSLTALIAESLKVSLVLVVAPHLFIETYRCFSIFFPLYYLLPLLSFPHREFFYQK